MVQEFMILRCFSCTTFQVHQVKKSKKWACKVCGEKQSVKKVYAQGSGQDCRKHVQKLNMKCGEPQRADHLAFDCEESPDFCKFSENEHITVSVENSRDTNYEDHIGLPKGESKWEKFLEINSTDDNGSEDFHDFHVTTERAVFDKASSRGKRKSAWHHSKSNNYHRGKKSKSSDKDEQVHACDMQWKDVKNVTTKTRGYVNQNYNFPQGTNLRMGNRSSHTLVSHDTTSEECHDKYQLCNEIPPCGDLQSNPLTSHNKCNVYFAKATRDPTPKTVPQLNITSDQKKTSSSSSKWAKFMPSSSTQNKSHDVLIENISLPFSCTPDNKYNDNRKCVRQTVFPSQQGSESQDLFKVDDDLDGEWWNSL